MILKAAASLGKSTAPVGQPASSPPLSGAADPFYLNNRPPIAPPGPVDYLPGASSDYHKLVSESVAAPVAVATVTATLASGLVVSLYVT